MSSNNLKTNNMQDNFVSSEIAILVEKLGFKEDCFGYYSIIDDNPPCLNPVKINYISLEPYESCLAPLFQQVQKWLRDNHNIHIYAVSYYEENKWFYKVEKIGGTDILRPDDADTYESALESGIKAALTYIKQKNNGI